MSGIMRNATAVLRGNVICSIKKLFGKCDFQNIIRIFKQAELRIDRNGKMIMDSGSSIGERCLCTVRSGGILHLGKNTSLNSDCKIVCHERIDIGDNTIFGPNVLVYDHDHVFDAKSGVRRKEYKSSPIYIGKNCWIGAGTIILRGTIIGDNCVVGAGSIIKGNYPEGSKIIKKYGGGQNENFYCNGC